MELNPEKLNKYLYIEKTPTWLVRGVFSISLIVWFCVLWGFRGAYFFDPFLTWFVTPLLIFFTIYHTVSYGLELFYKQYDINRHNDIVKTFWEKGNEPTVDIFLPICGEDINVLKNTWKYVSKLNYKNKKVYVLDDSKENNDEHERLAKIYGFNYLSRPNKGEMKKAGNLKHAYHQTSGEFIIIFDADFAPRHDFIYELLPIMTDQSVGIVQSPQYFLTTDEVYKRSKLEYGGGQTQENFYRFIQVSRDRFNATICCGSNAIYRRSALDQIGGTVQIEHSEDARTGFALISKGWKVRYVPLILAVGLSPDNPQAYFHQQHRWCYGSTTLFATKQFWQAPLSWKTKLCYSVGFLFYLHHPLALLMSFHLFWTLFEYNQFISISNGLWFYPAMIWGFVILFAFPISRFRIGSFYALLMQTYGYSHSIISGVLKSAVGWVPTNAKASKISKPFKQMSTAVAVYVFLYIFLIAEATHRGFLHLFNYNYYTIQFWIFYNLILSGSLLLAIYKSMEKTQKEQLLNGAMSKKSFIGWRLKTAGSYILLTSVVFFGIVYL